MSTHASRETRRSRADMPRTAWPRGREPRLRRRKRDAYQDLANVVIYLRELNSERRRRTTSGPARTRPPGG